MSIIFIEKINKFKRDALCPKFNSLYRYSFTSTWYFITGYLLLNRRCSRSLVGFILLSVWNLTPFGYMLAKISLFPAASGPTIASHRDSSATKTCKEIYSRDRGNEKVAGREFGWLVSWF